MSSTYKARYTRVLNQFKELTRTLEEQDENIKKSLDSYITSIVKKGVEQLQSKVLEIEGATKQFDGCEDRWNYYIAALSEEARAKEEEVLKNYLNAADGPENGRDRAYEMITQFQKLILAGEKKVLELETKKALMPTNVVTSPGTPSSSITVPTVTTATAAPPQHFKIEKMPLPEFDGSENQFRRFFQAFDKTVHNQPWEDDVKLTYLMKQLKGDAAKAVAGFDLAKENYQLVRDRLTVRFGDSSILKNTILLRILSLKKPGESYKEGIVFVDEMEALVQQAEALKMTSDTEAIRLAIEKALPRWMEIQVFSKKIDIPKWDLDALRTIIEKIMRAGAERDALNFQEGRRLDERVTTMPVVQQFGKAKGQQRIHGSAGKPIQQQASKEREKFCGFCQIKGNHWSTDCYRFKSNSDRWAKVKELRACYKCLRVVSHSLADCKGRGCWSCHKPHHQALCPTNEEKRPQSAPMTQQKPFFNNRYQGGGNPKAQPGQNQATTNASPAIVEEPLKLVISANSLNDGEALITGEVEIFHPRHQITGSTLSFFDCGANRTYVTKKLADVMELDIGPPKPFKVNTFAGSQEMECRQATVELKLSDGSSFKMRVLVVDRIVNQMLSAILPQGAEPKVGNIVVQSREPHILVGNDYFWEIVSKRQQNLLNRYYVFDSKVGPLLSTRALSVPIRQRDSFGAIGFACPTFENRDDETLSQQVARWIQADQTGLEAINSDDDTMAWELFSKSTVFQDGRYSVSLPLKDPDAPLPNNLGLAIQQLNAWLKKAAPEAVKKAAKGFEDWSTDDTIEEVPMAEVDEPVSGRMVYHPFHQISKKARIVHNASAAKKGEISLNGRLFRGPVMLPHLVGMLFRFRSWEAVALGDIKGAYLQLALNLPDKDLLRFVLPRDWERPLSANNMVHMRFKRLNFGLVCSAFLLAGALKMHFENEGELGAEILRNTYVDNIMATGNDLGEAVAKIEYAKRRLGEASMELRDLVSNDPAQNIAWGFTDKSMKMLGLNWTIHEETIVFNIPVFDWKHITKRKLLASVASVFDPLGLLSPAFFQYRLMIRDMWRSSLGWDEELPDEFVNQLQQLDLRTKDTTIQVPRKILPKLDGDLELHVFVDASKVGFGCCSYLKLQGQEHTPHLLFAKSKLAPASCKSVPKLELTAAELGTKMADFIKGNLDRPIKRVTVWSDNQAVLHWIAGQKWETLGRYATEKLHAVVNFPAEFRYIPTHLNPADLASRGCTPDALAENQLWWHGPSFLSRQREEWPVFALPPVETSPPETLAAVSQVVEASESKVDPASVTSWTELISKLGELIRAEEDSAGEVIKKGEIEAFRDAQCRNPPSSCTVRSLALFKDANGLWRATSRTLNREINAAAEHPIYMPVNDQATRLYVEHVHCRMQCATTPTTLAEVRKNVWIPKGRSFVKKLINRCKKCKRFRAKPFKLPSLPPLPKERVRALIPFENTGCDLAGPFRVKNDAGDIVKVWICLFNCLTTRAIHLELLFSLSTEELVRGIRRFISRRGVPKLFVSDNGTNFRATSPFIQSWTPEEQEKYTQYTMTEKIVWKHIPSLSPWQGGFYERMVKLIKDSLRKAIGNTLLSTEDFRTFVVEAEAVVNSRPITYLSGDDRVLRPIDFLLPNCRVGIPSETEKFEFEEYEEGIPSAAKRALSILWQQAIARLDYFWKIFSEDYLLSLQERGVRGLKQPRGAVQRSPRVGELVLVHDENRPRATWRCAKILRILEGRDNQVRSAEIEMENGRKSLRSIALLYPLEGEDGDVTVDAATPASPPAEPRVAEAIEKLEDRIAEAKYNLRPRATKNYIYFVLLTLCSWVNGTMASDCLGVLVYQEYCVSKGLAVYNNDGIGCAEEMDCGALHLKEVTAGGVMKNPCRTPCKCPEWAQECGHKPHTSSYEEQYDRWLRQMAPDVCWTADEDCSLEKTRRFHKIELFNGQQYMTEELSIVRKQAAKPFCTGIGEIRGPTDYCHKFPCSPNGTRFCLLPHHEYAFIQTPSGDVPMQAWATLDLKVYERAPKNVKGAGDCPNVTISCHDDGFAVKGESRCVDLLEICAFAGSKRDCSHYEELPGNLQVKPPNEYLVHEHRGAATTWRDGSIMSQAAITCPAKDVCAVSNCFVCWTTYFTPRCAIERLGGTMLRGILFLMSLMGIFLLIRKALRCRRRSPWGTPRGLMRMATFLALPSLVLGCGQVIAFHAPSRQCQVHRNGMVTCVFDDASMIALRGQDEACLVFRDHADRPITKLSIFATLYYRCLPIRRFYTRNVKLNTVHSRRCGGMGECSGDTCSRVEPKTKLAEFKATNDRPGVTRCQEACSGPGCGCLTFASGCFFSRTFIEPRNELVTEVSECQWEQGLELDWSFADGKSGKAIVVAGEAVKGDGIEIGAMTIASETTLSSQTFAKTNGKTRMLSESEIQAAQLFTCPTKEDAAGLTEECRLDSKQIDCRQADDRILCESRGNDFLTDDSRVLPLLVGENLYKMDDGVPKVQAKGSSTIQVKVTGLKAQTQVDVSACHLVESELTGCFACQTGATLKYMCRSDFGKQLAELKCGKISAVLQCDGTHQMRLTSLALMEANVDQECEIRCPGGNSRARITGHLVYVPDYGDKWTTGDAVGTERSIMEEIKQLAEAVITEHLPILLSCVAVILLLPKLIKFFVRLFI